MIDFKLPNYRADLFGVNTFLNVQVLELALKIMLKPVLNKPFMVCMPAHGDVGAHQWIDYLVGSVFVVGMRHCVHPWLTR
jgi:hypothetical protein